MGRSEKRDPEKVRVGSVDLRCVVCGHDRFDEQRAQLKKGGPLAPFDMQWADPRAICYVCDRCGYIHWFLSDR